MFPLPLGEPYLGRAECRGAFFAASDKDYYIFSRSAAIEPGRDHDAMLLSAANPLHTLSVAVPQREVCTESPRPSLRPSPDTDAADETRE
jgi:hypothetical protein